MGSIINKIDDDYDDYEAMCDYLGIKPEGMTHGERTFYDHQNEILKKHGCINKYEIYEKLKKKRMK